ncbi:MAG: UvrD-helicase domain-containing protein, partial [Planctomycetes bacterium]|nr:UvrD-helicase domain-containing protein [Planctomycetota bacterium]
MSDSILEGLTPEQTQAVTHFKGPMLVVAGAGSGKTRVVTRRIAWLLAQGVKPWQILALTFTNKAAGEMKERVRQLTGEAPRTMGTFHSLCARFLRLDVARLNEGRDGNFTIHDADDQAGVVKQIMKDWKIDGERLKPRDVVSAISRWKCQMIAPAEAPCTSWQEEKTAKIYDEYEKRLRHANSVDFDDLLLLTARMLEQLPELRAAYQRHYPFLLVDEYQDTNRLQYRLLRLLCSEENNLHATGDPDQSIYSWRGADYRNIMDFQKDYPGAKVVLLERNYRSTGNILKTANALIRHNGNRIDKELFTAAGDGEKVLVTEAPDDRAEAEWLAGQARARLREGEKLSSMAVLYRMNAQSRALEEALMRASLPYQIVGGVRFYERREVKDVLAHLKLRVNPRDETALARVVHCRPTGVGDKTLAAILAKARALDAAPLDLLTRADFWDLWEGRRNAKLEDFRQWCLRLQAVPMERAGEAVEKLIELSGLAVQLHAQIDKDPTNEERLENIDALLNRAVEFSEENGEGTLAQFLEDVALVADVDGYDDGADAITLMTLHSAKGLEFPTVFLVGLDDGVLPHRNAGESEQGVDEERRLFYVGITRAQKRLCISHANVRMLHGQFEYALPSPFLRELPRETLATSVSAADDDFDPFAIDDDDGWLAESPAPYRARGRGA